MLIQELMGLAESDSNRYRAITRYLLAVAGVFVLKAMSDLWRLELALGAQLPESRRYLDRDTLLRLRKEALRVSFAKEVFGEAGPAADQFAADETERRATVLEKFKAYDSDDPASAVRTWWRNGAVDETIDDWTRGSLRAQLSRRGSDPGLVGDSFQIRRVPSLRNYHAYKMARIAMNVGEGRRIRPSDAADADHYVCASYADIFVSDDRDLSATCSAIPDAAAIPIGLEAFVATYLDS